MLRGLYTAASGMIAQQRRQEMITNNMANANTPGYKTDQASLRTFPEMLIANLGETANLPPNNELATGVYLQETIPNFLQGDLLETERATDIAIVQSDVPDNGSLFFAIQTEDGVRYTRNGSFSLNSESMLVTSAGEPVLDVNNNPIVLADDQFQLRRDGTIVVDDVAATQLNVMLVANAHDLVKEGNGLFRFEGEGDEPVSALGNPDVTFQLQQGFIERSNVDVEQAMTDMLHAYRTFEANQRVLQAYDQSLDKAVNDIGRL